MKTVNYIMVAVVVTLGFSGCYDLDVAPYDKVAQNNYWKTEADAKSGVMGVYAQLKDYGAYGYMPLFDTYSDIGHGSGDLLNRVHITVHMISWCKTGKTLMMVCSVPIPLLRMYQACQLTIR
ncbi:RagB/SusD family nutrient uptake outer membrane protein [Bacteroides ovatus]|nr:RagB/SusD family nutrient uptake outer membrane protein [Bacteroides ovatus]